MSRLRIAPSFLVTLSIGACAKESTSTTTPRPDTTTTATVAPTTTTAPTFQVETIESDGPIDESSYTELVPGGFLCGPGQPMFTNAAGTSCLCHVSGNPPPPSHLVKCPKK